MPGPAMTGLTSVIRRVPAVVRLFGAGYVIIQVAIWDGYFAAHPSFLAGRRRAARGRW